MLGDVVREAASLYGDAPLYVMQDGRSLSYQALHRLSDSVASGLAERGVAPGDVVALLLPSGPAYAVAYAASAKLGAITAGVNERLSPAERARCLAVARPRLVLAAADWDIASEQGPHDSTATAEVVSLDPEAPVDALFPDVRGRVEVAEPTDDAERPVAIVFTSGTTGQPKGAVFAHRQLDAVSQADGRMQWGGGGRSLSPTSFAHVGFMTKFPQTLRAGGTTFLMRRWTAGEAIELAERHRVTSLGGIPTQMELMLRHERFDSADLSSVVIVALGGGPSTRALIRETRRRLGVPVIVRYTCTEAGIGTGTDPESPPEDAEETVGRARPGVEVTVRDEEDRIVEHGGIGHVCLRSAAVMNGFHRDRAATGAALTADGAVRTGDVGFVDDSGRLHLTGRSKEMYVRGGYNVFPLEVEEALADHPQVAHVAVAPRPDSVMGEVGVAVVVARRGQDAPTLEALREHARKRIASYKLPEDIVVVDELPRTAMEKVDRRTLAELVSPFGGGAAGGTRAKQA